MARSIREIVQEEMLHMALDCNMLAAIGGTPRICRPATFVPTYPGHLPRDVHPGLLVGLSGLNEESLETFLTIERPAVFPKNVERDGPLPAPERTIGEVYECILEAFKEFDPPMSPDHQIAGPLSWKVISTVKDVEKAIRMIQEQGEGSSEPVSKHKRNRAPVEWAHDNHAHYYRFSQIRKRKKLVYDADNNKYVYTDSIPFPDTWPMATVPKGGYRKKDVTPEVWCLIDRFDDTYSELLRLLQNAWRGDPADSSRPHGQAALVRAIDTMFELERYAKPLMRTPIPGKNGQTYGPCFRFKPAPES